MVTKSAIHDDIYAPEVLADPYTYYGRLREEDPIHWNEKHRVWILTRYEDAVWLARHTGEIFSAERAKRDYKGPPSEAHGHELEAWVRLRDRQTHNFIDTDPPDHTRMRAELNRYFTPKAIEEHRALIGTVVKEVLDRVEKKGRMEIMEDLAWRMPIGILYALLGVPKKDHEVVFELTRKRGELAAAGHYQDAVAVMEQEDAYLSAVVDARKAKPMNDLLQVLIGAVKRGTYSLEEVLAVGEFALSTGWSTQHDNMGQAIRNFLRFPDQWKLLVKDPEGLAPTAVEECLRYDATSSEIQRYAKQDIDYKGYRFLAGSHVIAKQVATNRDPRVFPNPEKFDITRSPNRHLTVGSGIHFCLGQYLARVNFQETFKGLARRFPKLHQDGEIEWNKTTRGYWRVKRLPVAWN